MTSMPLTEIFRQPIVKIDSWLIPPAHAEPRDIRLRQSTVAEWLDRLGEESSQAQFLDKQITTADKLRKSTDQQVYVYMDLAADNGRGVMLGFLRTGRKSLFFHKNTGEITQCTPDCILDFYVVEDHQRMGIGKKLFEFMLKDKGLQAYQLPIDKPSPKLLRFMEKHFGLDNLHVHGNNYAVTPQFFTTCSNNASLVKESHAPVGRYAAQQPGSQINSVIHGGHVYKKTHEQSSNQSGNSSVESFFGSRASSPVSRAASRTASRGSSRGSSRATSPAAGLPSSAQPPLFPFEPRDLPTPTGDLEVDRASTASGRSRATTPVDLKFYHTPLW